jgi:hypothetical protein
MEGFVSLLWLDLRLLWRRRLARYVLAAAVIGVVSSVLWSEAVTGEGFKVVGAAARFLAAVLIGLTTVQGAVSLSGDAGSGALRAVLMRPVGRPAVFLSRALVHGAYVVLVYACGVVLACVLAGATVGYGDVMRHEYVVMPRAEMQEFALLLLLLPLPALLVPPLLGLCLSVGTDDAATVIVLALLFTVGPMLFGLVGGSLAPWLFTERVLHPLIALSLLAEGVQLEADLVSSPSYGAAAIWQPAAWCAGLVALGVLRLSRRELFT